MIRKMKTSDENLSDELIINNQLSFIGFHLYNDVSQFDKFVAVENFDIAAFYRDQIILFEL